jgi:hypothetical protein
MSPLKLDSFTQFGAKDISERVQVGNDQELHSKGTSNIFARAIQRIFRSSAEQTANKATARAFIDALKEKYCTSDKNLAPRIQDIANASLAASLKGCPLTARRINITLNNINRELFGFQGKQKVESLMQKVDEVVHGKPRYVPGTIGKLLEDHGMEHGDPTLAGQLEDDLMGTGQAALADVGRSAGGDKHNPQLNVQAAGGQEKLAQGVKIINSPGVRVVMGEKTQTTTGFLTTAREGQSKDTGNTMFFKCYQSSRAVHGSKDGLLQPLKEVAASAIDQQIGFGIVPKTFFHKIDKSLEDPSNPGKCGQPGLYTVSEYIPGMLFLDDYAAHYMGMPGDSGDGMEKDGNVLKSGHEDSEIMDAFAQYNAKQEGNVLNPQVDVVNSEIYESLKDSHVSVPADQHHNPPDAVSELVDSSTIAAIVQDQDEVKQAGIVHVDQQPGIMRYDDAKIYSREAIRKAIPLAERQKAVLLDFILASQDRHERNFGFVNGRSGEMRVVLFDNGDTLPADREEDGSYSRHNLYGREDMALGATQRLLADNPEKAGATEIDAGLQDAIRVRLTDGYIASLPLPEVCLQDIKERRDLILKSRNFEPLIEYSRNVSVQ